MIIELIDNRKFVNRFRFYFKNKNYNNDVVFVHTRRHEAMCAYGAATAPPNNKPGYYYNGTFSGFQFTFTFLFENEGNYARRTIF